MKKIVVINGPNLNLTGDRQPEIYGSESFDKYIPTLQKQFEDELQIVYHQSNHEGVIVDWLLQCRQNTDAIIINPGAYTHTSIAIRDAVASLSIPVAEVHLSDISTREEFRKISVLKGLAFFQIKGQGLHGYKIALQRLLEFLQETKSYI